VPNDKPPEAHHIQIVIFDALMRRKVLVDQAGSNSHDFVRSDRRPNTTSTDAYPSIYASGGNGAGKRHDKIGIIVVFSRLAITEIDYLVTKLAQLFDQILL
jgi:hypothetical protein